MKNRVGWFGLNYLLSCGLIAVMIIGAFVAPLQMSKILPWLTGAMTVAGVNWLVALAADDPSCWQFQYALTDLFR